MAHFLLDTTVVNSYEIHHCIPKHLRQSTYYYSQREFRVSLLFNYLSILSVSPVIQPQKGPLASRVHPAAPIDHGRLIRMGNKVQACVPCMHGEIWLRQGPERHSMDLSNNSVRPYTPDQIKRRKRVLEGLYGCKLCGIRICNHIACWNNHVAMIPSRQSFSSGGCQDIQPC